MAYLSKSDIEQIAEQIHFQYKKHISLIDTYAMLLMLPN